ncbi:helix-turn-helix domain-containing protein [Streptomyces sp. MS19]|uniref:helix-turn-helix domain-containing protein n=1 Tax=Streptomyces sp. MS19 TaxID=3385972 RepID=UPI0039A31921
MGSERDSAPSIAQLMQNSSRFPTVLRIGMGMHLRDRRESAGLTQQQAGRFLGLSASVISRIEGGDCDRMLDPDEVVTLLQKYGQHDRGVLQQARHLALQANQPGWYHRFGALTPAFQTVFYDLEAAATQVRTYEPQHMPGLLQTPEYASAQTWGALSDAAREENENRIALRVMRGALLTEKQPPMQYWAVMDESIFYRKVGYSSVLAAQFKHLLEISEQPKVTLQVFPRDELLPGQVGAMTILRVPVPAMPDIVYLERIDEAEYIQGAEEGEPHRKMFDWLAAQALTPEKSRDVFRQFYETHRRA